MNRNDRDIDLGLPASPKRDITEGLGETPKPSNILDDKIDDKESYESDEDEVTLRVFAPGGVLSEEPQDNFDDMGGSIDLEDDSIRNLLSEEEKEKEGEEVEKELPRPSSNSLILENPFSTKTLDEMSRMYSIGSEEEKEEEVITDTKVNNPFNTQEEEVEDDYEDENESTGKNSVYSSGLFWEKDEELYAKEEKTIETPNTNEEDTLNFLEQVRKEAEKETEWLDEVAKSMDSIIIEEPTYQSHHPEDETSYQINKGEDNLIEYAEDLEKELNYDENTLELKKPNTNHNNLPMFPSFVPAPDFGDDFKELDLLCATLSSNKTIDEGYYLEEVKALKLIKQNLSETLSLRVVDIKEVDNLKQDLKDKSEKLEEAFKQIEQLEASLKDKQEESEKEDNFETIRLKESLESLKQQLEEKEKEIQELKISNNIDSFDFLEEDEVVLDEDTKILLDLNAKFIENGFLDRADRSVFTDLLLDKVKQILDIHIADTGLYEIVKLQSDTIEINYHPMINKFYIEELIEGILPSADPKGILNTNHIKIIYNERKII